MSDAESDKKSLYQSLADLFGKKAEEAEDGDEAQTDPADDAGQKDDGNAVDDLVRALADEVDADPEQLMDAVAAAKEGTDVVVEEDDDEEEEEEEDEEEMKADDEEEAESPSVSIDFGAKLDEHGVITEAELGERLSEHRESIVEDIGEKLAETQEEAIEEIGSKVRAGTTPTPAGGSFQDSQDFESHLEEITNKEGW